MKFPKILSYVAMFIALSPIYVLVLIILVDIRNSKPFDDLIFILPSISILVSIIALTFQGKNTGKPDLPFAYFAILVSLFFMFLGMKGCH